MSVQIVLDTLRSHPILNNRPGLTEKCLGCGWIGWDHDQHVAEAIDEAITHPLEQ